MEKVVKWKNFELTVRDFEQSHANGGRLNKLWVEDRLTGRVFLIKGSSKHNYEPFSEKIAYIIGKNLGIDVLEYDIIPSSYFKGIMSKGCGYVSICEKIDRSGYSISSVAEIKRAQNTVLGFLGKRVTNREVMYKVLSQEYIDTMLLFDAIIGNRDRHYGNVHVLRDTKGGIIGAPILDNGASLLSTVPTFMGMLYNWKPDKIFNDSLTIERTHDKQMRHVKSLSNISFNIPVVTMNILIEIQPVLDLMPKKRAELIERYIINRMRKYLGMLKWDEEQHIGIEKQRREAEESEY